jgi:thiol:disulfide interchange protein
MESWRSQNRALYVRAASSFAVSGSAFLLLGVGFYLSARSELPQMLVGLRPASFAPASVPQFGWVPTLLHVTAFGLLTCVFLRPAVASAIFSGAAWGGLNVLWEVSCAHPAWIRVPCTYDSLDIAASIAGAITTVSIATLILRSHAGHSTIAKEHQP